jgi:hypothetical protein
VLKFALRKWQCRNEHVLLKPDLPRDMPQRVAVFVGEMIDNHTDIQISFLGRIAARVNRRPIHRRRETDPARERQTGLESGGRDRLSRSYPPLRPACLVICDGSLSKGIQFAGSDIFLDLSIPGSRIEFLVLHTKFG